MRPAHKSLHSRIFSAATRGVAPFVAAFLILLLPFIAFSALAAVSETDTVKGMPSFTVEFKSGLFSVQAKEAPLGEVLAEIEKRSGFVISIDEELKTRPITLSFPGQNITRTMEAITNAAGLAGYGISYKSGNTPGKIGQWVIDKIALADKGGESTTQQKIIPPDNQRVEKKTIKASAATKKQKIIEKEPFFDKRLNRYVEVAKGEVFVRFSKGVTKEQIEKFHKEKGTQTLKDYEKVNVARLKIPATESVSEFIEKYSIDGKQAYIEPVFLTSQQAVHVNDPSFMYQWAIPQIQADKAWEINNGSPDVIVAVIDTGIDIVHPDLKNKVVQGIDIVNGGSSGLDDNGHGTHVAGIIAAESNNSIGIAGISWKSKLMPIKVLTTTGEGTYSDLIEGVIYAVDHGARVLNLSLGGYSYSQILGDAVQYAHSNRAVIVAAGGNENTTEPLYPAAYPNVIAVSATDSSDLRWVSSNYGSYIKLSAPGVGVLSTQKDNGYGEATGTSASTAHVSGVAALILSKNPDFSNTQVENILYQTADDLGDKGWDSYYGFGRVNALKGIEKAAIEVHDVAVTGIRIEPETFKVGEATKIIVTVENQGTFVESNISVNISVNGKPVGDTRVVQKLYPEEKVELSISWLPDTIGGVKITAEVVLIDDDLSDNSLTRNAYHYEKDGIITIKFAVKTHKWITEQAVKFLEGKVDTAIATELTAYLAELKRGADHEDCADIITYADWMDRIFSVDRSPICSEKAYDVHYRWLNHFYRPIDGQSYYDGKFTERRHDNALVWGGVEKNNAANSYDWNDALAAYGADTNSKNTAYFALGHVLHLLEDMSLPEHTHLEAHASDSVLVTDGYEEFIKEQTWEDGDVQRANPFLHGIVDSMGNPPIIKYNSIKEFFINMASISYYRNRFKGDLSPSPIDETQGKGALKKMFPSLKYRSGWRTDGWRIENDSNSTDLYDDGLADWEDIKIWLPPYEPPNWSIWSGGPTGETSADWWETTQFNDNKTSEGDNPDDAGYYYIEESHGVAPKSDKGSATDANGFYDSSLDNIYSEVKENRNAVRSDDKSLAMLMAEDLIPLAIRHVAGAIMLFWKETHPHVDAFSVNPTSISTGNSVYITYNVSASLGLKQVELWRATDTNGDGQPDWPNEAIQSPKSLSGQTSYSGFFTDVPQAEGTYWYGLHVVDNAGSWNDEQNSKTGGLPGDFKPVKVTVDATPPTISITAPINGSTVGGTATVTASANDSGGVKRVDFYKDNTFQFSDSSSPYSWSWNTTDTPNGTHSLYAKAYDAAGNSATSATITVTASNSTSSGGNNVPNKPTALYQYKFDGVTGMAAGATTNERTVVMKGNVIDPDNDAVSLEVEVRPVGTVFSSNAASTNCVSSGFVSSGGTAVVTCSGLADGQYKWQARTKDSKGAYSTQWTDAGYSGDVADFIVSAGTTTINNPPTVTVISPNGGETLTAGSSYTIMWLASDDQQVQSIGFLYSTNGGSTWAGIPGATVISNTGSYQWTVPNVISSTVRISALAFDGTLTSNDTSDSNFSIVSSCAKPSVPSLQAVAVYGSSFTVSWSASSGATSYTLQQDSSSSFTNPVSVYSGSGTSWYSGDKANGTYYYRVKATNSCGDSSWSGAQSATVQVNQGPGTITALSPADGATNQPLSNVTLSWNATHAGGESMRYNVYVSYSDTNYFFTNNIKSYGQTATTSNLSNLPYNTTISWGIEAIDDTGDINYSPMFHFKTIGDSSAPTGSILIDNGAATTTSYSVTLNLSASDSGSGVKYMRFSNDRVNWSNYEYYATQYQWNLADYNYGGKTGQTTYTVYAQFRDEQANESAVYSDTIDKAAGAPGNIILNGRYYETIRDAISAASSGDTVYLTEGIYTIYGEANPPRYPSHSVGLVMKAGVNLKGAGADKTTIQLEGTGLYTIIDADNSVIEGLTIINSDSGVRYAVLLESNSSKIKNCILKGTYGGIEIGYGSIRPASNSEISNNLIINNTEGIRANGGSNISISHNTIAHNTYSGISANSSSSIIIKNNIIAFNGIGIGTDGSLPVIQYNDVYVQGSYVEAYQNISSQTGINGNISSNPSFINSSAGDYRLNSGSPAIDNGTNVGIAYNGGAPDMGAYEYNSAGAIQATSNRTDAAFTIAGPSGTYTGSGTSWSQSSLPIGVYTVTFTPIANLYSPPYQSEMLYTGQTLTFDGTYSADTVPPTGKISVNFDEYATADNLVTLTFDLTDEVAGIGVGSQMMFSNDGATWSSAEPYSSMRKEWDLTLYGGNTTSGTKTVYAKVSDALGNWATLTATIFYVPNRQVLEVPAQYSTIQAAIDAAQDGDMVYVLPGTYEGNITLKAGVRLQGSGADKTMLQSPSSYQQITLANNSMIDGFKISWIFYAIGASNISHAIISNNVFTQGIPIEIWNNNTIIIRNSIFNTDRSVLILIDAANTTNLNIKIENNTFANVSQTSGSSTNQGIYVSGATPDTKVYVKNNIIANNGIGITDSNTSDQVHKHILASFNTYWNNSYGNFMGPGDMTADPMFVDSINGDFHLKAGSASIGNGDPDARYNDPDDTRNDRGAYGGPSLNTPPKADFSVSSSVGMSGATFTFNAGLSHDGESKDEKLQVRWDFDSDGTYDTSFVADNITTRTYDTIGAFNVTLQIKDEKGYLSTATKAISVVNQSPNVPASSVPADASTTGITPILFWSGGDPDYSDTVTYEVYFGSSANPPLISSGQTETYFNPGTLSYGSVYNWRVNATDNYGDTTVGPIWYFVTEFATLSDTIPPIGSILINDGIDYENSASAVLTFSATDDSGTVSDMRFSNDGTTWSEWEAYATTKSWALSSGDGTKTVYAQFKDGSGKISETVSDSIILDTVVPVTTATSSGGTYGSSQSVTLSASEAATIYFTTDGSTPTTGSDVYSAPITVLSTTTLKFFAVDVAGNAEAVKTESYIIDIAPPSGSIVINNGDQYTASTTVSLAVSATDDNGTVSQMRFSNDGYTWDTWEAYAVTKAWTLSSGDGAKTVYAQFMDAVGNVSVNSTDSITLDTAAPSDGVLTTTGLNTVVSLSWTGFTDSGSGISGYKLVYDTAGAPTSCAGTPLYTGVDTSYSHTKLTNGVSYGYRVCAIDNAGKTSSGITATATPVAPDRLSMPLDDSGTLGVEREDGGSDANNIDSATSKPRLDIAFNFGITLRDSSGNAPQYVRLYITNRSNPGAADYYTIDLTCDTNWAYGAYCSYPTLLGPAANHKYYFEAKLADGTVLRYPATGEIAGPTVELLNGQNMVGAPRDLATAGLDGNAAFGNAQTYKWVSEGITTDGNKGHYVLVDSSNPVKPGEGYFTVRNGGSATLPELELYNDVLDTTYAVTMKPGWNMLSNPYGGPVKLSAVHVKKGSEDPVAWADAATNGWVVNAIYFYKGSDWGSAYTFESAGGSPDATLVPWMGYWVYLNKNDGGYSLVIPRP